MADLASRPAVAPRATAPAAGRPPGVTLAVRPDGRQAILVARRGQAAALAERCRGFGVTLPTAPQRIESRGVGVVWIGPHSWLIDWEERESDRARRLFAAFPSLVAVVTADDARTRFLIAGPRARDTLAKMLTLDLHPRAFKPGDAAITVAGGMSVILWQQDEEPTYECAVPRSFAVSFWEWLQDSAAEYGVAVA